LLVKELGLQKGGAPTTEAGVAVVREALTEAGIPIDGVDIADGSGLAENDDHVTCASLTAVLAAAGSESELAKGLPVAGQSGTLEDRFGRTAANGRLAAKTGTLNGVTALSGFASPPAGPPLAFAIVANRDEGRLTPEQLRTVDQMAVILMSFPDSPDLAALGPEPPA
jgi:D-alanyl-D-alanine carboxypeptidase/D-alanyl-D-alanine-endopeptidase (penicillin-binding protein 4)